LLEEQRESRVILFYFVAAPVSLLWNKVEGSMRNEAGRKLLSTT